MEEEGEAVTLLCTLPEIYDSLVTGLSCNKVEHTVDDITDTLFSEELWRKPSFKSLENAHITENTGRNHNKG